MRKTSLLAAALAMALVFGWLVGDSAVSAEPGGVLEHRMKRITGEPQDLSDYKGQVVLIVNVASKCGLTPQYDALEKLYASRRERGFVVLGFPSNDFAGQEPGTDAEIAEFCRATYGVKFPMFSKITVVGEEQHPLYAQLTGLPAPLGGPIEWNFQKFLVDRSGTVVARYRPGTAPDDPKVVARIDALLAGPADR